MGKKPQSAENIKVLVRCRPLNEKEKHNGYKSCVDLNMTEGTVSVKTAIGDPDRFTFDAVINNTYTQKDIFTQYIQPLVDCVLDGFNATVFAYGQSGSGKTHTMTGVMNDPELEGVIPRCVAHIFETIKNMKTTEPNKSFQMAVTFVELYNGKVRDLLAKQQVTLDVRENKDHSFYVQGANMPQVKYPEDIFRLMEQGTERRRTASTELNADSSRSHSIFTLILECVETTENGALSVSSKLNLVDLAGSERQGKTGATGDTLLEGCNINLSLSALGTVIDTIVKGRGHIPFRSSQLTMLLKDSLGGNSKTVMFANINPSEHNLSETVSTLRFADRAKQIKNKPVVNMDAKDQKIAELSLTIQELKDKLAKFETGGTEALEKELEELREREGQLKVSLDNAVKGRQADAVDFENAQAKFAAETQSFNARMVEQEDQIAKLKNDLQIAENRLVDGASQANEILQICTTYLRPDKPFVDADDLQHHLRELTAEGGMLSSAAKAKTAAEIAQLQSKIQALESEAHTVKKEMKSKVKEMKERREEDKKTIQAAEARVKKLQADLKAVKEKAAADVKAANDAANAANAAAAAATASANAMKLAANVSSPSVSKTGSTADASGVAAAAAADSVVPPPLIPQVSAVPAVTSEELKVVKEAIETYDKQNIVNSPEFKKADACMEDLQRAHREVQNGVGHELSSLKKHLGTRRSEGDQALIIKELQDIVQQSDQTIASLMSEVATSHQLLANMRSVMKKAGLVPLSVVKGDPKVAEESLEALVTTEEQTNGAQSHLLVSMSENVARTTAQRNRLLSAICDGDENTSLRDELDKILEENQKLQKENFADLREIQEQLTQKTELAMQQQLADPGSPSVPLGGVVLPNIITTSTTVAVTPQAQAGEPNEAKSSGKSSPVAAAAEGESTTKSEEESKAHPANKEKRRDSRSSKEKNSKEEAKEEKDAREKESKDAKAAQEAQAAKLAEMEKEVQAAKETLAATAENDSRAIKELSEAKMLLEQRLVEIEAKSLKYKADVDSSKKQLHDLRAEFESVQSELSEERAARESQEAFKEKLYEELQSQREEISESERKNADLQSKLNDTIADYEQRLSQQKQQESQIEDLESRLQKRSEQLNQLRKLLETQKTLIVRSNEKIDFYQQKLKENEQAAEATKAKYERLLSEKDESVQRMINQRMTEYSEACRQETNQKQIEIKKLKKKIKKLQGAVAEMEEEFDKKVLECEEFKDVINELKVQHFKEIRRKDKSPDEAEVIERNEQIQSALEKAKLERQRRHDLFDMGEVQNLKSTAGRSTLRSRGSDASDGSW